jgi:hypothetical protein
MLLRIVTPLLGKQNGRKTESEFVKIKILNLIAAMFIVASLQTHAQGFAYDQQSATNGVSPFANNVDGLNIQEDSPLTQSFIPTLSAIGFIQLELEDVPNNGNSGATVYVNLWTGSPDVNSATFISSTTPVFMPNGFVNSGLGAAGVTNFYFPTAIALTAGQTYYLQPVVQSGDDPWDVITIGDTYSSGQLYGGAGGFTAPFQPSTDLWFREGVIATPEPTTLALIGVSGLVFLVRWRQRGFLVLIWLSLAGVARADSVVYYLQSLGGVGSAPYPMNPDSSASVEEVSPGVFVVEDGEPGSGGRSHGMAIDATSPPFPGSDSHRPRPASYVHVR